MVKLCENRLIKAVSEVGVWLDKSNVPLYSSRFSPKTYTQHQLLQGLVVKTLFRLRYRELVEIMQTADSLTNSIGLKRIPSLYDVSEVCGTVPVPHILPANPDPSQTHLPRHFEAIYRFDRIQPRHLK